MGGPTRRPAFHLPPTEAGMGSGIDDELRFHVQERIDELVATGMARGDAEREVARRFGDYARWSSELADIDHDTLRQRNRLDLMDALTQELRHAVRSLRRAPAWSGVAIATLALGLGATIAMFAVLESVVLRPLPYRDADRLVSIMHPAQPPGSDASKWGLSSAGYFDFRANNTTLEDLGAYTTYWLALTGDGDAERVRAASVTANLFPVLRAHALIGRLLTADDDRPGAAPNVVLSAELWRRRFAGDPGIVGRSIHIEGQPVTVVGVAEPGLAVPRPGPFSSTNDLASFRIDLWVPLQLDPTATPQNSHQYAGVGRLRPGATVEAAQRQMEARVAQFPERFPTAYSKGFIERYRFGVSVMPLREEVIGPRITRTLWMLFGSVLLVLAIAAGNVVNLFLVRYEARRREVAMRAALGADRRRLMIHHLAESSIVCTVAWMLSIPLASGGVRALLAAVPRDTPRTSEVAVRGSALLVALALAAVIAIVLGVAPAMRARLDLGALREGMRGLSPSRSRRLLRHALVVAQVALALVLLDGAGLMLRSFSRLHAVRPGFDATGVITFDVTLPWSRYKDPASVVDFHQRAFAALSALPGVQSVGASELLPLRDFGSGCSVVFREGRPYPSGEGTPCVHTLDVAPGFFSTLRMRVDGREPTWSDLAQNTGAVVVTRALADRLWPGESPFGKGINSNGPGNAAPFYRVVGVVEDLRAEGLEKGPTEAVFYPPAGLSPKIWFQPLRSATYVVKTGSRSPTAVVGAMRRALSSIDPDVPLANVESLEDVVARSTARLAFLLVLLGVAGALAMTLSAVGLYGVVAYLVGQRRAEIGVRMALGAHARRVATDVVTDSVRLGAIGVVIGLAASVATSRVLRTLLFDVSPTDAVVLGLVGLILLVVAAGASVGPAWRAARVDPARALRGE